MKPNVFLLALCTAVLSGLLLAALAGPAGGVHFDPVEKTVDVGGAEWRLRADFVSDRDTLEITRSQGDSKDRKVLASLEVGSLGSEGFDFAMSPAGNMLWLVLQRNDIRRGGLSSVVYPLVPGQGDEADTFVRQTITKRLPREGRVESIAAISSLNLTDLLRQLVVARWKKGEPLSLGRKTGVSNVRIECLDGDEVSVSGDLGPKYSFTGKVGLGGDYRVWTRDFDIIEIGQQKNPSK